MYYKEALFECYESTLEDLRCADIEDLHFEMNEAEILKETKIVQGPKIGQSGSNPFKKSNV